MTEDEKDRIVVLATDALYANFDFDSLTALARGLQKAGVKTREKYRLAITFATRPGTFLSDAEIREGVTAAFRDWLDDNDKVIDDLHVDLTKE